MARDFAAMLDELLAEHAAGETPSHAVTIDYLSVVDELHSGRINISSDAAGKEYAAAAEGAAPPKALDKPADTARRVQEVVPPIEPEAIARELGLMRRRRPKDLDRVRRDFAFKNHPDRVAVHLRQRAMVRMQIANRLIDEAKRGKR